MEAVMEKGKANCMIQASKACKGKKGDARQRCMKTQIRQKCK